MDGYLFTEDIDVSSVLTRDDLAAMLRVVHIRADRPSLRALEAEARHYKTPLSKTVVSEMLKGTRFPRKAVMLSFLRACGVAEEAMAPWRRRWERVATTEPGKRPRLLPTEHDDGQSRSAPQAVQARQAARRPSRRHLAAARTRCQASSRDFFCQRRRNWQISPTGEVNRRVRRVPRSAVGNSARCCVG